MQKLDEKFYEIVNQEGSVAIATYSEDGINISNTWNHYLMILDEKFLLIPAAGMNKTQTNIEKNGIVKLSVVTTKVEGFWSMGAGYCVDGIASFHDEGEHYEMLKEKCPFLTRALVVEITKLVRTA